MKTSSVPLYWWSEHTVAEPVIRHTPGELLGLKSCATCAINRRKCNQCLENPFQSCLSSHTVELGSKQPRRHEPWYGTPAAWACNLVCLLQTKQNKTQSDCLNNRLKVWKVETLTTSRGFTITADIKAAPPADKALSPNLKFSFATIGFDFESNFASSSTTIRNQFNFKSLSKLRFCRYSIRLRYGDL